MNEQRRCEAAAVQACKAMPYKTNQCLSGTSVMLVRIANHVCCSLHRLQRHDA